MNWLKKLKSNLQNKEQAMHEQRTYEKYKTAGLARQCMECKHFTYRVEKPRNWVCRCPDAELKFVGNTCLGWKLGSHPEMVIYNSR
jgi:hypothetical protein